MGTWVTTSRTKMLTHRNFFFLWVVIWAVGHLSSSLAYEASTNFSGGHLKGTVRVNGPPTPPKRYNLVLNPDPYFCGRISDGKGWRLSPFPIIGPNHGLKGAIVYLQDVTKGKPFSPNSRHLRIQNCLLLPSTEAMQTGEEILIENWDPVQHQLEVFLTSIEGAFRLFGADLKPHPDNRKSDYLSEGKSGTPRPGTPHRFPPDRPGILFFRCNFHEYMEGWRVVVSHPYYTMTQDSGDFVISDIPPGSYLLKVWHPLGTHQRQIEIHAHDESQIDVLISPTVTKTHGEDPSPGHPLGIDLVGDERIVPTVELQQWNPPSFGKSRE